MATKIQFHFQFPRSPDAAFGGRIGWLLNWKYEFECRILSNIASYVEYNYFLDDEGLDNIMLWLWYHRCVLMLAKKDFVAMFKLFAIVSLVLFLGLNNG